MGIVKRAIVAIAVCMCVWNQAYSQVSRVAVTSVTPSISTGQDYSPWLNDDITSLVLDNWSSANMQYIDVKLKLQSKTNVTQLSLYDFTGIFTTNPAQIYAVNGTTRTLIGTFTGPNYLVWDDINLSTPVLADTIIIHKYGNNIPQKIKVYGTPAGLSTPITGYMQVCPGSTTSLGNASWGGTWTSGNTAIATINSSTGVVTGVAPGNAVITYTFSGLSTTATVTVNAAASAGSIAGAASVCAGSTATLSDAATGGTWSSSATGVATVNSSGIVTGVASGSAIISYTVSGGCGATSATKTITVSTAPSAGTITGASSVCTGSTTTFTDAVTGGTWSSSSTGVAAISATGVVSGVSAGTATISYTVSNSCGTAVATKTVTVSAASSAGTISGASSVCAGSTTALTDAVSGGTWSSSATSVATVNTSGVVTGVSNGTATISYSVPGTCGAAVATKAITVNAASGAGTITGTTTVTTGSTTALSDAVTGGSWSSSATGVATVNSSGVVTGVSVGTAIISYSVAGACGTAVSTTNITVNTASGMPALSTPITGYMQVCAGGTTSLGNASWGGTWTSSNTSIATINSSTAVVTGVSAGTATISYVFSGMLATAVVTVNASASGTITGASSVCTGSNITLSDASAGGTWSSSAPGVATVNSSGVVTGVSAGTATISYSASGSCGTTAATQVVTVGATSAGTITGTATVTAGSTTTLSDAVSGGTWSSSATGVATVNSSGVVTGVAAGTATISYVVTGSCGSGTATMVVTVSSATTTTTGTGGATGTGSTGSLITSMTHGKIPIDGNRWYQLNNCTNGLQGLFDGNVSASVSTGWGKLLTNYDAYYPLLPGEVMYIDSVRFYSGSGSLASTPFTLYYIDSSWNKVLIGTFVGGLYNTWVGPNPSSPSNFALTTPITNARYLLINCSGGYPNEMELYGSYMAPTSLTPIATKTITLGQEFGVNGFAWDLENPSNPLVIDPARIKGMKSFTGFRHYLDWKTLEPTEGGYTFSPSHDGGWNLDSIYLRCKAEGITVLADIKTLPDYMVASYPSGSQDAENVPVMYGSDLTAPASYIKQAKVAFQFAARYGSNTSVSTSLLSVDGSTRWTGDPANTVKVGLNAVKYIECDNERDKWWKGRTAYQTGREYAANLSAFYDGNKNTMGPGVGVKNADPNMKVVMGGVASPTTDWLRGMIDWCRQYRGYNSDGSVNLCWDVINYHIYPDNAGSLGQGTGTQGSAPEVAHCDTFASNFINVAHTYAHDMPVWVTETGYDINQGSVLKAIPIGSKSVLQTQADWTLRNSLLYARMGVERVFFYMTYDLDTNSTTKFSSSGLLNPNYTRKPVADYLYQANRLMGNYVYKETISTNPLVDRYELGGQSIYVLVKPSQNGSTTPYSLNVGTSGTVHIYTPAIGRDSMNVSTMSTVGTSANLTVTETPMFVSVSAVPEGAARESAPEVVTNAAPESAISVYPNPTSGSATLSIENEKEGDVTLMLYTETGRMCKTYTFSKAAGKATERLDLSPFPNGMYLLQIIQGNEHTVRKIIKINQ